MRAEAYLRGIQLLIANRLSLFGNCKPSLSFSVTDQKGIANLSDAGPSSAA
jgi:hypothetical protein